MSSATLDSSTAASTRSVDGRIVGILEVGLDDPGVLAAPSLRGVDDQRVLRQRHAGQAAGGDVTRTSRDDEGTYIDVAWFDPLLAQRRRGGELDDRLGDPVARIRGHGIGRGG